MNMRCMHDLVRRSRPMDLIALLPHHITEKDLSLSITVHTKSTARNSESSPDGTTYLTLSLKGNSFGTVMSLTSGHMALPRLYQNDQRHVLTSLEKNSKPKNAPKLTECIESTFIYYFFSRVSQLFITIEKVKYFLDGPVFDFLTAGTQKMTRGGRVWWALYLL